MNEDDLRMESRHELCVRGRRWPMASQPDGRRWLNSAGAQRRWRIRKGFSLDRPSHGATVPWTNSYAVPETPNVVAARPPSNQQNESPALLTACPNTSLPVSVKLRRSAWQQAALTIKLSTCGAVRCPCAWTERR